MAAGTVATAAGAAVLLYYALSRKLKGNKGGEEAGERSGDLSKSAVRSGGRATRRIVARRPAHAPATWLETLTTLSETLRFTYSETLGKWPIGDLAFGINYLMRRQGNLQVASVYAGNNCVQLKCPEIVAGLNNLLRLLTICMYFTKKPFPVFLESSGFSQEDVLLQKPKAGLLKPAFTIICDQNSKCFLLLIRGTHGIKDTLTAATGAVVPFHHSVLHDGGISNLVLGYAHCGMVAAARWIAKLSTPFLLKALEEYPDYRVKIVGHSLGGGTAALLTYILREQKEFSSITCVTFAPAACMTWDLAESGKHFITTVINGSDLVPTFSAASLDDLRSEVTASSWLNDLRDQVERTRVLNVVYRSATALGSRLPSIASAKARVAGAGALLRPVSSSTQVVMKRAQNVAEAVVRTRSSLTSWSCMGARRRTVDSLSNSRLDDLPEVSLISERSSEAFVTKVVTEESVQNIAEFTSSGGSGHDDSDEDERINTPDRDNNSSTLDNIVEDEFWHELEKELQRKDDELDNRTRGEEAAAAEEENILADAAEMRNSPSLSESHHFYPPGKIMHIVSVTSSDSTSLDGGLPEKPTHVGLYETPREMYNKIRLSKTMIKDHYMPMYKKMMELLIMELENDETCSCSMEQQ
ncbi:Lipase_3 domain-containing protein/Lipase3_N domain-containing protein [Cephalotus follicularis]|uniref:Lipase_3 domain-containing protein/Lipase3_N domain-containing protein n=1 Tax=Cephalotus follicularis TaxID=3775 RepID=A0A1Q3B8S0_CEPFO|nr:Lipase_3 domain-containing protein/Lipase3_N domain-containing protein [Cephalotus follicularis]